MESHWRLKQGNADQTPGTLFQHTEDRRRREQRQKRLGGQDGGRCAETRLEVDKESSSGPSQDELERLSYESRWAWKGGGAERGETKAPQMGQGTVGGERVGARTPSRGGAQKGVGEGPGSDRGRQNCWPPAALCSWLRNVPSLPGDFGALMAPSPYQARQHRELWGCLP